MNTLVCLKISNLQIIMISVKKAIEHFIFHCTYEKNLSIKTLRFYSIDLCQFMSFLGNKKEASIDEITKVEVRGFLESIFHLMPKSIKRKMATLKALFNFLEFDDVISINPVRKVKVRLKEVKKIPTVLNVFEIEKILILLHKRKNTFSNCESFSFKEAVRNITVIELLFATGGRVSEIANLRLGDLDLETGVMIIRGKGNKERIVQICNEETLLFLRYYMRVWNFNLLTPIDFFLINRFGNKLSDQSIRNLVTSISKDVGISKKITPHVFRHSFATLLLEEDVDIKYIQSLLGHSSIVTTQIYTQVSKTKQRQLLTLKHPRRILSFPMHGDRIHDN